MQGLEHAQPLSPADLGFGRLFARIQEAVVVADVDTGRIVLWNPAAERLFGYSAAEARTLSIETLMPEPMRPAHRVGIERYRREGHGPLVDAWKPVEVPALRRDGSPLWIELSLSRIEEALVPGDFVLAIIRDVTERREITDALREQADLLDLAHDAILVRELDSGIIRFWNRGAERTYGWTAEEALGHRTHELLRTRFPIPFREIHAAVRQTGGWEGELRHTRRDGVELVVASRWAQRAGPGGEPMRVLEINRDVTAQTRQRERREALLRVARTLAAEPDAGHVFARLVEEVGRVVEAHGAVALRWDAERDALVVSRITVDGVPEGTVVLRGHGAVGQAVDRRAPVIINDYQRAQGVPDWAVAAGTNACIGVPLLHEGRLLGALAVLNFRPGAVYTQEDGDTLELLASLAAAALEGVARSRLEGVLLAARTTQHEMNNTLAAMSGRAQLLARDPRLPPDLHERAQEAARLALRAGAIVRELLDLTDLTETHWGGLSGTTVTLRQGGRGHPAAPRSESEREPQPRRTTEPSTPPSSAPGTTDAPGAGPA